MTAAANVVAFPATGDIDLEQVHARAGSLDFLAELVDGVVADDLVDVDPALPDQLREMGDVLVELACRPTPDPLEVSRALAGSAELLELAIVPICHSSTRRMLGAPLYERIVDAVITLGELGMVAYEREADEPASEELGIAPMRRFTRVIANAYDWANWNVDASPHLRQPLVDALHAAARQAGDEVDITHEMAPTDAVPLANALDELHDAWLKRVPGDVLAEYVAERDAAGSLHGCFDLGVACSIARRLLAPATGVAMQDSARIGAWIEVAGS
jgi:hypothetical protein